jgi:hypothetical protein
MIKYAMIAALVAVSAAPASAASFRVSTSQSQTAAREDAERRGETVFAVVKRLIAQRIAGESKATQAHDDARRSKRVAAERECERAAAESAAETPAGRLSARQGPEPVYLAF